MIKPYGQRVAVVDPPAEDQTSSGLILPPGTERLNRGIVIGVGDEVPHLSEGDMVWYGDGCGLEIDDLKVLPADCIIAWEAA